MDFAASSSAAASASVVYWIVRIEIRPAIVLADNTTVPVDESNATCLVIPLLNSKCSENLMSDLKKAA